MYENEIYSGTGAGPNTTNNVTNNNTGSNLYGEYYTSSNHSFNDRGNIPPEKKKKNSSVFTKIMLSISLGLFFGLFAGIGFLAVQQSSSFIESKIDVGAFDDNIGNNTSANTNAEESKSGIKLTNAEDVRVVSSDVSDVVEEAMPAMVSIVNNFTQTRVDFFGQNHLSDEVAAGSGIIIGESENELLIVSNQHVVADATTLDVTFIDGSTVQAQLKGTDSNIDLAVIAVPLNLLSEETKATIAIATLGDSDSLELGHPVIAIGNALGYGQSVTNGIVSALDRQVTMQNGTTGTFIQTNAAINPGNSGGALLNVKGEVVGINSNKIGGEIVEGMGYAIPISAAKPIISDLMLQKTKSKVEDGKVGYMGITRQTVTPQYEQMFNIPVGVYVRTVEENSPADIAGMLPGDVIVKFDGNRITTDEEFLNLIQYYAPDTTVSMVVNRVIDGVYQEVELTITLGERPDQLGN